MNIKLHLDKAEYDPIERTAEVFGCAVEDVVYTAVNEYMLKLGYLQEQKEQGLKTQDAEIEKLRTAVLNLKLSRKQNLPLWADSAGGPHNYEGFPPDQPRKGPHAAF
jgi:hypothetical protein